jgi:hypothetical protein
LATNEGRFQLVDCSGRVHSLGLIQHASWLNVLCSWNDKPAAARAQRYQRLSERAFLIVNHVVSPAQYFISDESSYL